MKLTPVKLFSLMAAAVFTLAASAAHAAPIFIQDYEAPGNLDAPFNLQPHFSGSTQGVKATAPGQSTTTHVPADGAIGTAASAELFIPYDPATVPVGGTGGGWGGWQVRLIPNNSASNNAANPLFATDGYVGYWLKVDSSVAADMLTGPVLEPASGTGAATLGNMKPIIKDGRWHLYQWNMDDPNDFLGTFDDAYGGALGDTTLEASVSFDSIAIVSNNTESAIVRIDQIGYDNAGPLVPEPTAAVMGALAALGLVTRRRRA